MSTASGPSLLAIPGFSDNQEMGLRRSPRHNEPTHFQWNVPRQVSIGIGTRVYYWIGGLLVSWEI